VYASQNILFGFWFRSLFIKLGNIQSSFFIVIAMKAALIFASLLLLVSSGCSPQKFSTAVSASSQTDVKMTRSLSGLSFQKSKFSMGWRCETKLRNW
jgi:hypothetical protein